MNKLMTFEEYFNSLPEDTHDWFALKAAWLACESQMKEHYESIINDCGDEIVQLTNQVNELKEELRLRGEDIDEIKRLIGVNDRQNNRKEVL